MVKGVLSNNNSIILKESRWIRANKSGIFIAKIKVGEFVNKGDLLGEIAIPHSTFIKSIISKKSGYIFGLNNNPIVNQGDALFHIGE